MTTKQLQQNDQTQATPTDPAPADGETQGNEAPAQAAEPTFTQSELNAFVAKRVAAKERALRREFKKETAKEPTAPQVEETAIAALDAKLNRVLERFDENEAVSEFESAVAPYNLTPAVRELVELGWKQKGKPELSEFVPYYVEALGVPGGKKQVERGQQAIKAQADRGAPSAPTIDAGPPAALRDHSSISNPADFTSEEIRTMPISKLRQVTEGYFERKGGGRSRLFSKRGQE